jgi:hypothetical protein
MILNTQLDTSSGDATLIELPAEITLGTVAAAHRSLVDALDATARVTARLATDAVIDLAGVQLLIAARRAAGDRGGVFELEGAAENELLATLRRGGFLATADQRAFWLKEEGAP